MILASYRVFTYKRRKYFSVSDERISFARKISFLEDKILLTLKTIQNEKINTIIYDNVFF